MRGWLDVANTPGRSGGYAIPGSITNLGIVPFASCISVTSMAQTFMAPENATPSTSPTTP